MSCDENREENKRRFPVLVNDDEDENLAVKHDDDDDDDVKCACVCGHSAWAPARRVARAPPTNNHLKGHHYVWFFSGERGGRRMSLLLLDLSLSTELLLNVAAVLI